MVGDHLYDFDVLREDADECSGCILGARFLVCVDSFRGWDELGIAREEMFPDFFGVFDSLGGYLFELAFGVIDRVLPFREEG